ncbi:MAG TPA: hypothetical protein PKD86_04065 [Gemmatales bacterium]|nr:hypothetical protein [Gemmatales bacterium]
MGTIQTDEGCPLALYSRPALRYLHAAMICYLADAKDMPIPKWLWFLFVAAPALVTLTGCQGPAASSLTAPPATFAGGPIVPPTLRTLPHQDDPIIASHVDPNLTAARQRVRLASQRLSETNPNLGFHPTFRVAPGAEPRVGVDQAGIVVFSQGLVEACASEGQLTAVMAYQAAELYRQRLLRMADARQRLNREPPMVAREGLDNGAFGQADRYHLAEIHKLGLDRRQPALLPDPPPVEMIARQVLLQAGYAESDLQAGAQLLQAIAPAVQ